MVILPAYLKPFQFCIIMGRSLLFYILKFCVEAIAKLCFSFFRISLKILFLLLLSLKISSIACSLMFHSILDITSFQDGIESTRTEPATTTKKLYYTLKSAYCGILKVYAFFFNRRPSSGEELWTTFHSKRKKPFRY